MLPRASELGGIGPGARIELCVVRPCAVHCAFLLVKIGYNYYKTRKIARGLRPRPPPPTTRFQ